MLPKEVTEDLALRDIFNRIKLKAADICIMLAVAFAAIMIFAFASEREAPTACVIEINGEEFARYDLPAITGEKVIEIDNEYGRNTIIIDKNGAAVTHSNCADKYEVKAGKITSSGQSLICLPHRLTVRLEGAEKSDGIAW